MHSAQCVIPKINLVISIIQKAATVLSHPPFASITGVTISIGSMIDLLLQHAKEHIETRYCERKIEEQTEFQWLHREVARYELIINNV